MDNGKIWCFRMIFLDFSSFQLVGTYLIKTAAADQSIDGDSIYCRLCCVGGRAAALDCY